MEHTDVARPAATLYAEFVQYCRMAEAGGMSAIWTGEHHGMTFTISPNPFVTIAALAQHIKTARLGTGTIIAPFWHPIKLAGEAAMTDIICGGRLDIGIARGAYRFEYERLAPGLDAWAAGQRMREIIPATQKLWRGDYAHNGEFFQFPTTTATPAPAQAGGPPIWVAARDPSSFEFAAANGCHVQVTPLWQGMDEVAALMEKFRAACAKAAPAHKPQIMLLHHVYVGADAADARQGSVELGRFFCYFAEWFANRRAVSEGTIAPLSDDEVATAEQFAPARMRADLTVGTADEVADKIKRYQDLGYDEFSYWLDSGMAHERKRASLARFLDEVIPKVA